jgi:hypothetical protein
LLWINIATTVVPICSTIVVVVGVHTILRRRRAWGWRGRRWRFSVETAMLPTELLWGANPSAR